MSRISLIVGLGNPGPKYAETRHNAGFWFVDEVARRLGTALKAESRFHGEVARVTLCGGDCRLLKPTTYMNHSGQAIQALASFYKIPLDEILVAHDDLDLPPGAVRFKQGGGHGGHNGLRDTIGRLGKEFLRLRLGIGHPGHRDLVHDYVLGKPPAADREALMRAVDAAADELEAMVGGEFERVMNRLHSR